MYKQKHDHLKIFKGLSEGYSAKEVSTKLNVSVRTIEWLVSDYCQKMNCKNRTHLITKLIRLELI